MPQNPHTAYVADLTKHLREYRRTTFPDSSVFDGRYSEVNSNPPVFTAEYAHLNLLLPDDAVHRAHVSALVPVSQRHRWFRSMKSSQALAQSVFGNIIVQNRLDVLAQILADDGGFAFGPDIADHPRVALEYSVGGGVLREPTPTSVDFWISGRTTICVECKLAEEDVGSCSRPEARDHPRPCNGNYEQQEGRSHRCALADDGVAYWDYIPAVVDWAVGEEARPCPLRRPYQLVRNILAACVSEGVLERRRGHAVLVYDARNPMFQKSSTGTFDLLRNRLKDRMLLRRCPWQRIVAAMAGCDDLHWLVRALDQKYGLRPEA